MMENGTFPGEELRRQRESLGLSLNDVCVETHIPIAYLAALETGDISALPSLGYCIGFLKTYCQFLRLPHERYIDAFRIDAGRARRASNAARKRRGPRFAWYEDALTWAAVCAILLLAWFAYSVVVRPQADSENRVEADTREMVVPPASVRAPF